MWRGGVYQRGRPASLSIDSAQKGRPLGFSQGAHGVRGERAADGTPGDFVGDRRAGEDAGQVPGERGLRPVSYTHLDVYKRPVVLLLKKGILRHQLGGGKGLFHPLNDESSVRQGVDEL